MRPEQSKKPLDQDHRTAHYSISSRFLPSLGLFGRSSWQTVQAPSRRDGSADSLNPIPSSPTRLRTCLRSPCYDNMANIDLLQRQQKVCWPEFSWRTVLADETSRCFQMFSPDISRVGYTDKGRVYSIICPQQGVYHPHLGTLNIEVTVTGNRGWVDEKAPKDANVAADLTTQAQIWFSPGAHQNSLVKFLWTLFANNGHPFPSSKAQSIKLTLHNSQNKTLSILPARSGESTRFKKSRICQAPQGSMGGRKSGSRDRPDRQDGYEDRRRFQSAGDGCVQCRVRQLADTGQHPDLECLARGTLPRRSRGMEGPRGEVAKVDR